MAIKHPIKFLVLAVFLSGAIASPVFARMEEMAPASKSAEKKNVLFLNSYHAGYEWSDEVFGGIHSVLGGEEFNIFTEYLDSQHHNGKEYTDFLKQLLRYKYANSKIDAIIASDHYAVKLALDMRGTFQRGVPLVYLGIDKFIWERREEYQPIYGLEEEDGGVFGTLELVASIHRNVKLIYVVADGDTESTPVMLNYVREVERSGKSKASFKYLVGMSREEIEAALRAAPPDSVVVWLRFLKDKNGRLMSLNESQKWLAGISPVPVYCPYGFQPGSGVMGGHIISGLAQGKRAAEIVVRILEGESPPAFYGTKAPCVTVFDYPVMRRFGIGLDALPADSLVYNKPSSVFQKYRLQILGALTLIVVLSAMVVYLLLSLARRQKAETALSESEERMTLAAETTGVGVWIWNIPGNEVWGSERWLDLFGFAPDAAVTFEQVIQRVHPDDRKMVEDGVRRALADRSDYLVDFRVVLPDGNQRWMVSRGRMYQDSHGKPARMVGTVIDITHRKQAEAELTRHRTELAHVSRVSTMGALTASLAHELNQPLSATLSNAQAALRFLTAKVPDVAEVQGALEDIVQDTRRAGEVIRQMRALVRKDEPRMQSLDINQVISEVVRLLHSDMLIRKTRVTLELDPDLRPVSGDSVQLQQVLLNLAMNAFDAMRDVPDNRRVVTIRTRRPDPALVRVEVSDCGTGLSPEKLLRLFEPFSSSKREGLGLGLSISHSIIEAHKGRIWAENNPDGGATFYFTLPLHEPISNLG